MPNWQMPTHIGHRLRSLAFFYAFFPHNKASDKATILVITLLAHKARWSYKFVSVSFSGGFFSVSKIGLPFMGDTSYLPQQKHRLDSTKEYLNKKRILKCPYHSWDVYEFGKSVKILGPFLI